DTVSGGEGSGGTGLMLSEEVVAALEPFGATTISDMRGRFRWSHAFIGVKSSHGFAKEDSSPLRPARVSIGPPLHSPLVAARFDSFALEPAE
ncbi:MAG: hypothetical protein H0T73_18695, partial [Ardenticatenales bacterium]|nr:hypothetical protein [Ardenticatenales bacterium]